MVIGVVVEIASPYISYPSGSPTVTAEGLDSVLQLYCMSNKFSFLVIEFLYKL